MGRRVRGTDVNIHEAHFLATAFVLHLALPVAAYVAPEPETSPLLSVAMSTVRQEIDVDVSELPMLPRDFDDDAVPIRDSDEPLDAEQEGGGDPNADPRARRRLATAPDATANPDDPPPGDEGTLNANDGAEGNDPNDAYGLPPSAGEIGGPGYGAGGPLWARAGIVPGEESKRPGAPTRAPRRRHDPHAGTKALKDAMRDKDKDLGLDLPAASAIAGVIRGAVRASETPYECTASLTVTLSGSGNVTAVSLNSFSGGSPGAWQNVRKQVLAQLKGISYKMKSAYEKGAIIGYGVTSLKKTPGGGTGRDGLTLKFDVTDIGARATRQVKVGWSARPAG